MRGHGAYLTRPMLCSNKRFEDNNSIVLDKFNWSLLVRPYQQLLLKRTHIWY